MLVGSAVAAGICVLSLVAGLVVRTRLARSPAGGAAGTGTGMPLRWGALARALLRPDRGLASLAIWLMFLDTVLALAAPWPLMVVVDYGLGHHRPPSWITAPAGLSPVLLAAAAAAAGLLLLALGSLAGYLVTFLTGTLGERMTVRLRAGLVEHLLRAAPQSVARYPLGELTNRAGGDTVQVADTVTAMVDTLIPDSAILAGMTVITALLDWRLTLVVLCVIPLYALTARMRNAALRPAQRRARTRSGELATLAAGLLARVPLVHVFDRAAAEAGQYRQASVRAADAAVSALDASARFAPVTDTLPGLGLAGALVAGTIEVSSGRLTIGGLLVFLAYLSSLTTPVRSLARLSTAIARGTASRDRVAELLRLPLLDPASAPAPVSAPAPLPAPAAASLTPAHHSAPVVPLGAQARGRARHRRGPAIRLERVSYAHRAGHQVLSAASLDVAPGSFVCVTGPSGSGKSTLLSLVMRLADPDSGRITLDGHDIGGIALRQLRELVTLVPQDPWLQAGTIAENIGYGRPGATRGQIMHAAGRAGVSSFATGLPDGWDTQVGEHGRELSGGQQRRVAVARALLRDTPVILLDEPTAGLDPVAEARLVSDLLDSTAGKTLILVTHQPRLTAHADQVIRVEGGCISSAGAVPVLEAVDSAAAAGCRAR